MAAQGVMVAAQALRATAAVASALDGSGERDAAGQVRAAVQPLLRTLDVEQQSDLWAPARSPSDAGAADNGGTAGAE